MKKFSLENIQQLSGVELLFRRLAFVVIGLFYPVFQLTFTQFDNTAQFPQLGLWLIPGLLLFTLLGELYLPVFKEKIDTIVLFVFTVVCLYLIYLAYLNNFGGAFFVFAGVCIIYAASLLKNMYALFFLISTTTLGMLLGIYYSNPIFPKPLFFLLEIISASILYLILASRLSFQTKILAKERELQFQKEETDNLLNSLSAMIVYKDLENRIVKVNLAHANFVGQSIDFFIGKSLYDFLPSEEAKKYHEDDLEIIRTETPKLGVIEEFTAIDQKKYWVRSDKRPVRDNKGNITGVVVFSVDVTAQIKAQKQLKKNEDLFRGVFEEVPYGVLITDLNQVISNSNHAVAAIFNNNQKSYEGSSLNEYIAKEYKEQLNEVYQSIRDRKNRYVQAEINVIVKDKKARKMSMTFNILHSETDEPQVVVIMDDITERKRSEEKLKRYSEDLEETNKDLEQFAYIASHDLKEPLRMISGYTSLLRRRYSNKLDGSAQEFITFIMDGSRRITRMLDDLLHYSRASRDKNQKSMVEVSELIFTVMMNLRIPINERKAEIVVPGELPQVYCSKFQISLVLQNLLANAIKYCHSEIEPNIQFSVTKKGDYWVFSIKDNGIGMEQEHLNKIFLIFKRLHRKGEFAGSGVGLAICKRIIQAHKGKIWAESEIGKGSTFYFSIPDMDEEELLLEEK